MPKSHDVFHSRIQKTSSLTIPTTPTTLYVLVYTWNRIAYQDESVGEADSLRVGLVIGAIVISSRPDSAALYNIYRIHLGPSILSLTTAVDRFQIGLGKWHMRLKPTIPSRVLFRGWTPPSSYRVTGSCFSGEVCSRG